MHMLHLWLTDKENTMQLAEASTVIIRIER